MPSRRLVTRIVAGAATVALGLAGSPAALAGAKKAGADPKPIDPMPKVGALKIPTKKPSLGTMPKPTTPGLGGQGMARPVNPLPTVPGTPSEDNREQGPSAGIEAPAPEGGDPYGPSGGAGTPGGTPPEGPQPE